MTRTFGMTTIYSLVAMFSLGCATHPTLPAAAHARQGQSSPTSPNSSVPGSMANSTLPAALSSLGEQEFEYPESGVALGQGWDTNLGQKTTSRCVVGTESTSQTSSATSRYQYIFDREQLQTALSVSVSASYGGFGTSASVQSSFTQSTSIDTSSTYILGSALVERQSRILLPEVGSLGANATHISISKDALALLLDPSKTTEERLAAFYHLCGDSFVTAIKFGGRYDVLFRAQTSDLLNKQAFSLGVSASGYGASGTFNLNSSATKDLSDSTREVKELTVGIEAPPVAQDPKSAADNLTKAVQTNGPGGAYVIVAFPYIALARWPTGLSFGTNFDAIKTHYKLYLRLGCTGFQRHPVKVEYGTGGGVWRRGGCSAGSSSLRQ